jgi:hypothetical protein
MAGLYDKYKETGSVKQPKMHDGLKFGDKGFFDTHFPSGSPRDGKNPKMMGKLGNAGTKNNPLNFKDLDLQNAKAMDYNQSKPPMLFHDKQEKAKFEASTEVKQASTDLEQLNTPLGEFLHKKMLSPVSVGIAAAQSERVGLKSGSKILKKLRNKKNQLPPKPTE